MRIRIQATVLATALLLLAGKIASPQDLDSAKGELLLKRMSAKLAAAASFSFSTTEFHDTVKLNGERARFHTTRDVLVRRPDGFWTKYTGDRDWEYWYDGKLLTGISSGKKVYIQHETPPGLDETMDMLAMRFNLDLPVSDVLYSSPYDAFVDAQTHGGLAGNEDIDGSSCNHLKYSGPVVDWQLWIGEKSSLPCRLEMTYKNDPKSPKFYRITFRNWDLAPKILESAFVFKIPEGYARIPMLERVILQKGGSPQTQTGTTDKP